MTVRTAELLMGIATLLLSLGLMWNIYSDGLRIDWVDGRGPGAGVWPFWLSLGMALASVATLVRWYQGKTPESRSLEPYIAQETLFLVTVSALSVAAADVARSSRATTVVDEQAAKNNAAAARQMRRRSLDRTSPVCPTAGANGRRTAQLAGDLS